MCVCLHIRMPFYTLVNNPELYVSQLVKLLELREANHIEFCRIKNVLDEILHMQKAPELCEILQLLMDPTWVATGLKIDFETLVSTAAGLILLFFLFFFFRFLMSSSLRGKVL